MDWLHFSELIPTTPKTGYILQKFISNLKQRESDFSMHGSENTTAQVDSHLSSVKFTKMMVLTSVSFYFSAYTKYSSEAAATVNAHYYSNATQISAKSFLPSNNKEGTNRFFVMASFQCDNSLCEGCGSSRSDSLWRGDGFVITSGWQQAFCFGDRRVPDDRDREENPAANMLRNLV